MEKSKHEDDEGEEIQSHFLMGIFDRTGNIYLNEKGKISLQERSIELDLALQRVVLKN